MSVKFYEENAPAFFQDTVGVDMSSIYDRFTRHLNNNSLILDAGCGSGRDTKAFIQMGYLVEAFDGSHELASLASEYTGIEVKTKLFEDVNSLEKYDGIWCCASLLHVAELELPNVMAKFARALKPNGVWYLSFKHGNTQREKQGRFFTDLNEQSFRSLILSLDHINVQSIWITQDKRPERNEEWLNVILKKV